MHVEGHRQIYNLLDTIQGWRKDSYKYNCFNIGRRKNFLSSRLLSKNVEITKYKIIILPVVMYGCRTLSLALRE
jgi:hypothetical protein